MPNRLSTEQSTYLLQHAHNPVDWYPWGDEAFALAKAEDKPVLVSIGYAACHWCHVMERESFEHEQIARFMNEHFVCVKVDREEHPEVDHLYMDAVTAISGSGGWPLNVFVTPDKEPFYGGTYFPPSPAYQRPSWIQLLGRMSELWNEQRDEVLRQAKQLTDHIRQATTFAASNVFAVCTAEDCEKIATDMLRRSDRRLGGFGNAPKFPFSMAISSLLLHYTYSGDKESLDQALLSLDAMANGGIYDQLGGGFARYSTDASWLAPHFEKMLYDNALLLLSYSDAWQATGEEKYKTIITETIGYINRELKHPDGGFYASMDADSEGVEGKFYTWDFDEFHEVVGEGSEMVGEYFGVTKSGNWEHTNILHLTQSIAEFAAHRGLTVGEVEQVLETAKAKLIRIRDKRIRPVTEDKCLLSWNAWMNAALVKAGIALQNDEYIAQAEQHAKWMLSVYETGGHWTRSWKEGVARIPATLDDFAALIYALLQLSSATGLVDYLIKAEQLLTSVSDRFLDKEQGYFYFTPDDHKDIPVRKIELYDGAIPSANAVMAYNLMVLGILQGDNNRVALAEEMTGKMLNSVKQYSISYGFWAMLLQQFSKGFKVVVCLGAGADGIRRDWLATRVTHSYLVTSQKEISDIPLLEKKYFVNKTHIFVCSREACQMPVETVAEALQLVGR